ncbi:MAG: M4 family peptidase, partial [Massilia sp.]
MIPQPLFRAVLLGAAIALAPGVHGAPMMSPPLKLDTQAQAQVITQLTARRPAIGLDADHGYRVVAQHPGVQGTHVVRAAHL